jgi:hypothetical protein
MTLRLPPHIHAAALADDLVLLDTRADSYLCIRDGAHVLVTDGNGRKIAATGAAAEALAEAGLAVLEDTSGETAPVPELPTEALPEEPMVRLRLSEARDLALALWDLLVRYRARSFEEILTFAGTTGEFPAHAIDVSEILRLAQLFRRYAVWLPMPRKCLVRSFVLLRFLRRSGHAVTWVFGVRTWPFGAHCWLQCGATALDDAPERLATYEPIMAVGS